MFRHYRTAEPEMVAAERALPGRDEPIQVKNRHTVNETPIQGPFPENLQQVQLGLGCFWGAERKFWQTRGVYTTAVGYAGGFTPNPTYEEVCSGLTGHTEAVLVVFDTAVISFAQLLQTFWESHNPTEGMRQGNDIGTQYRSAIYTYSSKQEQQALASLQAYQKKLSVAGFGKITTEIKAAGEFYYAENYHQQYLAKNIGGYCGLGGTGISFE
ncbi:MAG: peptide-methionine (S)-S-oxide reductase MsrA [Pseudomonadales bacterium]|nr:peptide-methionine (S)-S-oxide reductase MsrA [Pseudomonadales bacterium]MCP5214577.1 peptide-methionine (S)-S-oxide reductase MsrA [Pseudomonadales bacterium]